MLDLLQSTFTEALGWSLVDSLWQTGVLWGVYCFITWNGTKFTAAVRHNLALLSTSFATLWFLVSLIMNYNSLVEGRALYSISYLVNSGAFNEFTPVLFDRAVSVFSSLYITGIFVYSSALAVKHSLNQNLYKKSFVAPPSWVVDKARAIASKLNITRPVAIWLSEKAVSPFTTGTLKPVIFFPLAAINHLSSAQVEAVLVHELFHVKRRDYLLNLLLVVADVILFFNPFARLLCNYVRKERENRCDDQVIALGYDAWDYSQALYVLGANANGYHHVGIAATGDGKKLLLGRIKRLLNLKSPSPSFTKPFVAFFLCLSLAVFSGKNRPDVPVISVDSNSMEFVKTLIIPPDIIPASVLVFESTTIVKQGGVRKTITISQKRSTIDKEEVTERAEEVPFETSAVEFTNIPVFVQEVETSDFTLILPEKPSTPIIITKECPAPFVPSTTLYCPVDSLRVAKKVIVHI